MKQSANLEHLTQPPAAPPPVPVEGHAPLAEEYGPPPAPLSWRDRILRLGGSWVGFTGLYAVTGGGACPFCGQPSCPTGFLSAGIVGGVLAVGLQAWREKRAWRERRR